MVAIPVVKLGSLVLKTLSKPVASRLKQQAGIHPKFRNFIMNIAQDETGGIKLALLEFYHKNVWRNDRKGRNLTELGVPIMMQFVHPFHCKFEKTNHRFTTTMQRRLYGHATDVEIRPLNEEKAVQAAVDLLGELFVFSVAGAAVIFEVQRSARSEARKEELRKQELEAIKQRSEDLAREVDLLKNKLDELEHHAKGRGLAGILNLGKTHASEAGKSTAAA